MSNPDKAFNRLIKSDLSLIEFFTKQENLDANEYIKIKKFLTSRNR